MSDISEGPLMPGLFADNQRLTSERNEALAALARVRALITGWQGGTGHTDNNKFVSIADLRAALDPPRLALDPTEEEAP